MEKQFLEMDMDPATLVCVNPYEVNPIIMEKTMLPTATLSVDVPLKGDHNVTPQKNWDMSYGGVFYGPQRKVKLEMEEFSDLSSFVLPKPMLANSVDELNTPIFDKDAFDFNVNVYQKDYQSEELRVKLECDAYYGNGCIITDNSKFKNYTLNTGNVHQNGNITSDVGNNIILQSSDINVFSPQSEDESVYNCTISPSYENTNTTIFNVDDNSALSVNSNKQFSNVEPINEGFHQFQNGLETPEDSNSSTSDESIGTKPTKLLLHTDLKPLTTGDNLNTPSIIEEVVDLESSNFNILDLVSSEDIRFVNSEDIFAVPPTVILPPVDNKISIVQNKQYIPQKRPRKRRACSDDDEDYIPPTKKNVLQRKTIIRQDSESEYDSDATETEIKAKNKPRGRPPKRTESVSSDCSKENDASKYRELRDKNNEASRKSRLKRKIKELEFEKEADELICKNIKLKAQVEELEKMVTNFRDNLFKIMIKK